MTTETSASGTDQVVASGQADPKVSTDGTTEQQTKDMVAYETHRKLLGEKKRLAEQLASANDKLSEYEQATKTAEEQRLKDNEQWKEIASLKEKEAHEAIDKLKQTQTQILDAQKLDAFLSNLDGTVDRKFWNHIETEKIIVNPDTGEFDDMSIKSAVETFKQTYPEIIQRPGQSTGIPNTSPKVTASLDYEAWKQLPAKEMAAKMAEVINNDN